jgi:antitoxin MazE
MDIHCGDIEIVKTRAGKWGNSLAVRIPGLMAREAGIHENDEMDISLAGGEIVIKPGRRKKYKLADLLAGVTAKNRHGEALTGQPAGREEW